MRTTFLDWGGMKNAHTRPARKTFHFERTRRFGEQVEVLIVRGSLTQCVLEPSFPGPNTPGLIGNAVSSKALIG
jgi:hypothetical protein